MYIEESLQRRADLHAALGEPGRLAIVDALATGDAAPGELADQLGMGTNLLAHHLNVLDDAGLIRRRRSEGDRRRSYVSLVPQILETMDPRPRRTAQRVVFVCSQNSARSQLAAALWKRGSHVPVDSAGTRPADEVHPKAVAVARRHGLAMRVPRPRHLDDVVAPGDLVVAVCDNAHEELGTLDRLHWSVPDPVRVGTDDAFESAFTQLNDRVTRLAQLVGGDTTHHPTDADQLVRDPAQPTGVDHG